MSKEKRKHRFSIRFKVITMIAILAAIIMTVAISYYSIMVAKLSKETYSNIASDIAESTAQVLEETEKVEKIKYLKTEIDKIYKESPTKPRAEESSERRTKNLSCPI